MEEGVARTVPCNCSNTAAQLRHIAGICRVDEGYLPIQKLEKILPSKSSELKAPVISPKDC